MPAIYVYSNLTHQNIRCGIIIARTSRGKAHPSCEIGNAVRRVQVCGYARLDVERLGQEIRRNPPVRKPPSGAPAGEIPAIGLEIAPGDGRDEVIVPGIDRGVPKDDDRRDSSPSSGYKEKAMKEPENAMLHLLSFFCRVFSW